MNAGKAADDSENQSGWTIIVSVESWRMATKSPIRKS